MRLVILLVLAGTLLLSVSNTPADQGFERHTFEARVGDLRIESRLLEEGRSSDDRLAVTVPARLFEEPLRIRDVRTDAGGHGRLIDFVVAYWRHNLAGDREAVIRAWCEDSRDGVRRLVDNDALFKRNQRALSRNPGLVILGVVRHGETTSILHDRGHSVAGVTLRTGPSGPCLVNEPADDRALAIIEAAFD